MSSYKRIPRSLVKKMEDSVSINDRYQGDAHGYVKNVAEEELEKIREDVKEQEKQMLVELEEKKEQLIEQAYTEGFERAKAEVEEKLRIEKQRFIDEAQKVYQMANQYRMKLIQEAEQTKEQYLHEKKDEILDFIVLFSEKLMKQQIETNPEMLETLFKETIESIRYESKKIYLRVHPKSREKLIESNYFKQNSRIELLPDATLDELDMIVETEREYIDATLDTKIQELKDALRSVIHD